MSTSSCMIMPSKVKTKIRLIFIKSYKILKAKKGKKKEREKNTLSLLFHLISRMKFMGTILMCISITSEFSRLFVECDRYKMKMK